MTDLHEEVCELCEDKVDYCECRRCELCGELTLGEDAVVTEMCLNTGDDGVCGGEFL
jgi:hypothetical protein